MSKLNVFLFVLLLFSRGVICAETYDPAKATGVIKGTATFLGDVPKPDAIDVTEKGSRDGIPQLRDERLVVSAEKKLANLVVYVSKGYEKYDFSAFTPPIAEVATKGCQYSPHITLMKLGQELEFKYEGDVVHNPHINSMMTPEVCAAQPAFQKGYRIKPTASELGIGLKCDVHSWMKGYVCVFEHPFFAVTDSEGRFEIKLPPGEYEISFWHELLPRQKAIVPAPQKVTVADSKPAEVNAELKLVKH